MTTHNTRSKESINTVELTPEERNFLNFVKAGLRPNMLILERRRSELKCRKEFLNKETKDTYTPYVAQLDSDTSKLYKKNLMKLANAFMTDIKKMFGKDTNFIIPTNEKRPFRRFSELYRCSEYQYMFDEPLNDSAKFVKILSFLKGYFVNDFWNVLKYFRIHCDHSSYPMIELKDWVCFNIELETCHEVGFFDPSPPEIVKTFTAFKYDLYKILLHKFEYIKNFPKNPSYFEYRKIDVEIQNLAVKFIVGLDFLPESAVSTTGLEFVPKDTIELESNLNSYIKLFFKYDMNHYMSTDFTERGYKSKKIQYIKEGFFIELFYFFKYWSMYDNNC